MLFLLMSLFNGCKDDSPQSSVPPVISFQGYELLKDTAHTDSLLILTFDYEDPDGDIGLNSDDTLPPFNSGSEFQYNLFLDVFELKNGQKLPVNQPGTTEPEVFDQRIPNLTPTGRNRKINGSISIRLDATRNYLYPDSVECKIQIADRALNKSNVLTTQPIVLTH